MLQLEYDRRSTTWWMTSIAKWPSGLCLEYTMVLLPEFKTQRMVLRNNRRLSSKTARAMVTWSHYRFRQRLLSKTREYPWCRVVLVNESYTSKTYVWALWNPEPEAGWQQALSMHLLWSGLRSRPSLREEHPPSISHHYQRRAGGQTLALGPTSSHLPRGSSECKNHICHESSRCCDQMWAAEFCPLLIP